MHRRTTRIHFFFATLLIVLGLLSAFAQIGGRPATDGPFVLDNWEDLNFTSESLGRDWLFSVLMSSPEDVSLSGSGLTLAPDQSPVGAIQPSFPDDNAIIIGQPNSIFGDFGIPVPGVAGASTDPNAGGTPGDIRDFERIEFVHCFQLTGGQATTSFRFNVLLECYPQNPDDTFPTLQWSYTPSEGTTFTPVSLDLRAPTATLNNPDSLDIDILLSQTRFLNFFFFASPVGEPGRLDAHVDDIVLTSPFSSAQIWGEFE